MEVAWGDQPMARGSFPPVCKHMLAVSCLFLLIPFTPPALLKAPTYSLLIMRKPDDPAKGFPLPPPWGGR